MESLQTLGNKSPSESAYARYVNDDDDLDDLDDHEDFGFGFEGDHDDPNKAPRPPTAPGEDIVNRTSNSVTLVFPPHNQLLKTLVVQYIPADLAVSAMEPFGPPGASIKKGVLMQTVPEPATATSILIPELRPGTGYYFRLVAKNPRGAAIGASTQQLTTLEYAPPRGDFCGFLYLQNPEEKKKGMRRLSFTRTLSKSKCYVWVVLDKQLLTWAEEVDGKEIGRLHMQKLKCIFSEEGSSEATRFVLQDTAGKEICFEAISRDPKLTSEQLCYNWITKLRAVHGTAVADFGVATNTAHLM